MNQVNNLIARMGPIRFLLVLMCVSLGLWIALAKLVVPSVIESAYRGESLTIFNSIIQGQDKYPVDHYLRDWDMISQHITLALLGFGLIGLFMVRMINGAAFFRQSVGEATQGSLGPIRVLDSQNPITAVPIVRLHRLLTAPLAKTSSSTVMFWFGVSLAFAAIFGILGLKEAFMSQYVVQDDARQHVFWMRRFLDPALFPHDIIADYFQSIAPFGYTTFYRLMTVLGIDPLVMNKFLPIVLGLITTGYCFGIVMQILPVPMAGFLATLLLNQNLWMRDDLVSATPRAFLYPLFLVFLYYLLRRSLLPCLVVITLQGLFYPQVVLISVGILLLYLLRWEHGRPRFSMDRSDYLFCATGLAAALLVLLPYALKSSEFGPVITAAEARALPEFSSIGRTYFFVDNPVAFWLYEIRSGILPSEWWEAPLMPPQIFAGLLLPIVLRYPSRFPLSRQVASGVTLLPRIVLASLGMFLAAHALLFKLQLPSRYTQHSLRVVMAIAAGIALTVALDAVFHWAGEGAKRYFRGRQVLTLGLTLLLGTVLVLYPSFLNSKNYPFPLTAYRVGEVPALYEFLSQQPKDILIASLAEEADNLPTFSQRSILVGREYAIPYHVGYYRQIHQRVTDLIRAQYSQNLVEIQDLIRKYGVDFLLLDRAAFTPEYLATHRWIRQFQLIATEASARLEQGAIPALEGVMERCSVLENKRLILLQGECVARAPQE